MCLSWFVREKIVIGYKHSSTALYIWLQNGMLFASFERNVFYSIYRPIYNVDIQMFCVLIFTYYSTYLAMQHKGSS